MKLRFAVSLCIALGLTRLGVAQSDVQLDTVRASGLAFLARQQADDGSFTDESPRVASTALSLMALLSSGHTQDVGRHGLTVRRAVDFLLKTAPADGYFGRVDGSRMYGQGIVTLALAQAYGVEPDAQQRARIRAVVERAVAVLLKAQDVEKPKAHAGGWRYEPQSSDSDLSVTAWNLHALHAAGSIGVSVPKSSIERALAYVMGCYRAEQSGFAYQSQADVSQSMTAVGVLLLGKLDSPQRGEFVAAAKTLSDRRGAAQVRYPCYTLYHTTAAAYVAGDPIWSEVWETTRRQLTASQQGDGGWPAGTTGEEPGRVYATAMALLTLNVPRDIVPSR